MPVTWNSESLLGLSRNWQQFCVLAAAARLDLFSAIGPRGISVLRLAENIQADKRALTVLLDALAAMNLLTKNADQYSVPDEVYVLLGAKGPEDIMPLVRHSANLMPRWLALPEVVKTGASAPGREGGAFQGGELEAFIGAMHNLAAGQADALVRQVSLKGVTKILDVGGGPGTYTIAFLRANPTLSAVLFDRPEVIAIAREHVAAARLTERVTFVGGDFYSDALPSGCELAWVSAIIHMNSRQQNRDLFAKVLAALAPGGTIIIRDHVMDQSRTSPVSGALFAINMLVGTAGGGTYTFDEIRQDLQHAGFANVELLSDRAEMNCLVSAQKVPDKRS